MKRFPNLPLFFFSVRCARYLALPACRCEVPRKMELTVLLLFGIWRVQPVHCRATVEP